MNLRFQSVNIGTWPDFEKLFETTGGPHYCWCMVWRNNLEGLKPKTKTEKKMSIHQYVTQKIPVGLLAYSDDKPIAWCSIAPRNSYRNLGGYETTENVWSLACFFIMKAYRKQGLTKQLVKEAIRLAKNNGAQFIEAYPVDPKSPSYRFMGLKPVFEELGFEFVKMTGSRRHVMIRKI